MDSAGAKDVVASPVVVRVRTRREAQRRVFLLVGMLAALQLFIDAVAPFLSQYVILAVRLTGALVAAVGTVLFEMYKAKRDR